MNLPDRHVVIEFAGMPKSGKTTVLDVVSHYLRRNRVPLSEFHGGGRYAPIGKDDLGRLNLYLATQALQYLLASTQRGWSPKVHLMDRGLVDRTIFTRALLQLNRIGTEHAATVERLFALPELEGLVDVCAVFVTSPELSLEREQKNKLIQRDGRVMNTPLLSSLGDAALRVAEAPERLPCARSGLLVDTARRNGEIEQTAWVVLRAVAPALTANGIELTVPGPADE